MSLKYVHMQVSITLFNLLLKCLNYYLFEEFLDYKKFKHWRDMLILCVPHLIMLGRVVDRGRLNRIIGPRAKECTGAPTYTTNQKN